MNEEKKKYTRKHRKAFLMIEKQLIGHNTLRGYLHDLDKLIMLNFVKAETASRIHRKISKHHNRAKTKKDYTQMIIDWECARYTKPDKPLNARETLAKYYPELTNKVLPIINEYGL